jgi:hypothetical protein
VIVRNTYRELADTTLQTWLQWFPEADVGAFSRQDMAHRVRRGDVDAEFLFRALDRPQDVAKLLSLEVTGGWVNEARELPKGVIDTLGDRVGRYPAVRDGGPTWSGVIMDTNPPDNDHWWYRLAEDERPEGWEFFRQPGGLIEIGDGAYGLNPEAENTKNLPPDYYMTRKSGKSPDYVKVYYCAEYGFVQDGKPMYPEYRDSAHCTSYEIEPVPSLTLYVGVDFGLTPAAVFAQRTVTGGWRWIDELVTEDMGAVRFAEALGQRLRERYAGYKIKAYGDPAGDDRSQVDERTPFQVLQGKGIPIEPAPTNDPLIRREAVATSLLRFIDGKPGLLISPVCKVTRKGMAGGYHRRRMQISGEERYHDEPVKNRFSHPCEAGQYLMLGAGEGASVIPTAHKRGKIKYPSIGVV